MRVTEIEQGKVHVLLDFRVGNGFTKEEIKAVLRMMMPNADRVMASVSRTLEEMFEDANSERP